MRGYMNGSVLKSRLKNGIITALIAGPSLALVIISAVYQLLVSEATGRINNGLSVVMGVMVLIAVAASLLLSVIYRKKAVPVVFATVFAMSFICYFAFTVSGMTDIADDSFFEMLMLIFSLPITSYMSVPSALGVSGNAALLVISFLIAAVSTFLAVYIEKNNQKGADRRCKTG